MRASTRYDEPTTSPPATRTRAIRETRGMIAWALEVVANRETPPSAAGFQIERLRNGMSGSDDGALWRAAQSGQLADRDFLKAQDVLGGLTEEERRVVELYFAPMTAMKASHRCTCKPLQADPNSFRPASAATVPRPKHRRCDFCARGGGGHLAPHLTEIVERTVPVEEVRTIDFHEVLGDAGRYLEPNVASTAMITDDGGEFVRMADRVPPVERVVDEQGRREVVFTPSHLRCAVVRERRALRRNHEDVGAELGISARQVRRLLESANSKVRETVAGWSTDEEREREVA